MHRMVQPRDTRWCPARWIDAWCSRATPDDVCVLRKLRKISW